MFGFVLGGLAVSWGVLAAYLDQPGAAAHRRANQLCTALLTACTAATAVGGVASLAGAW
ncbi:hypothetical protein Ade02nite_61000 [Paractinoplanes deccanensis]|uniref:Uncharacterized protein n=1 Tax=Paractinoplanes deccanensis TaxID=113561 RepID=A0ABQ3YBU2_9ACTN|nr:hypothetical protein [Actinoplanes deccanensis]GID77459.1 hypothetical protein Ade02nite_61000 [Actinoplanes deccanensis]